MGAAAPTLFGAIELLVNNQTAIFGASRIPHDMPSSSQSERNQTIRQAVWHQFSVGPPYHGWVGNHIGGKDFWLRSNKWSSRSRYMKWLIHNDSSRVEHRHDQHWLVPI